MWYVIQTVTGQEDVLKDMMQKIIPEEYYRECFYIKRECADKEGNGWRVYHSVLFPGYVFVVTEDMEKLHESLKSVIGLTRMIGTGREIVPISEEERQFLLDFGGEKQMVPVSVGIIENSVTKILSGPLKGKEGLIRKIDRHKRKAWLEVEMFGRKQEIQVGLEIVAKTV